MSATQRTNWFWSDWLGDQAVRRLTPAERGVWIDCLALMATANPIGYLCDDRGRKLTHEEVARVVNATPVEVSELLAAILEKGVASVDRTGRIYNRRMVREASMSAKRRRAGKVGGDATRLKWQELSALPQQRAWHLPRQPVAPPSNKESKKPSSEFVAAGPNLPARLLATALPSGALARSPDDSASVEKPPWQAKRPSEMSRSELQAFYAARAAKTS